MEETMSRKFNRFASAIFLLALLAACGPVTPMAQLSSYVPPAPVITPENINQLREIYRIGRGNVQNVGLSPDGKLIAVTASTGIYIFDADTFVELKHIRGSSIEFSPDNKYFSIGASLYKRATLEVIKTFDGQRIVFSQSGKTISTIPLQTSVPTTYDNNLDQVSDWTWQWPQASVVINDDGSKMVASTGQDLNISSKDKASPIKTLHLQFSANPIELVDDDQFLLAYGGKDDRNICDGAFTAISLIDLQDGSTIFQKENCIYWSRPIYVEPVNSEKLILVFPDFADPEVPMGGPESYVAIINLKDKTYQELRFQQKSFRDKLVSLSPNGEILAEGNGDSVNFWKLDNIPLLDKTIKGINRVSFSPDSGKFFALTEKNEIEIRGTNTYNTICSLDGIGRGALFSFSPNGKKALLWIDRYQELQLLDVEKCEIQQRIIWPSFSHLPGMSFSSDSKILAFPGEAFPWLYEMDSHRFLEIKPQVMPTDNVRAVAFLPDNGALVVGGEVTSHNSDKSGFLYLWNRIPEENVVPVILDRSVTSIQTTSNRMIISTESNDQNRIWDDLLTNSKVFGKGNILYNSRENTLTSIDTDTAWIFSLPDYSYVSLISENIPVAVSPTGNYTIFKNGKWNLAIKNIDTSQKITTWSAPDCASPLSGCEIKFDPREKMVIIGTTNFIEFRNLYDGKLLHKIVGGNWRSITFSPNGAWMAVANDDGTISLWGIPQP
jgi:WD40 repeat protein